MYCLGCKDHTYNFKSQDVKMWNKVLKEKSDCVVCRSSKSRFLKQKHNNKLFKTNKTQVTKHAYLFEKLRTNNNVLEKLLNTNNFV